MSKFEDEMRSVLKGLRRSLAARGGEFTLRVVEGPDAGRTEKLRDSVDIGRHNSVAFRLRDERVSGVHARFTARGRDVMVEDLGSSNGTYVNGVRIAEPVAVSKGDHIRVGGSVVEVSAVEMYPTNGARAPKELAPQSPYGFAQRRVVRARLGPILLGVGSLLLCAAVVAVAVVAVTDKGPKEPLTNPIAPRGPVGTVSYEVKSRNHLLGRIKYPQNPPVGGDHNPVLQTCGFYSKSIDPENGVHSLEHGAVWVTYQPQLPTAEVDVLRRMARQPYVLVTKWAGLSSPVVATAWGRQLRLGSVSDARLTEFMRDFRGGPQAPERGRPCTGGAGIPEER